jgi:uncharacterized HAD superfamily protein
MHFHVSHFVHWDAWEIAHISEEEFFRTLDEAWFDWKTIPPTELDIGKKIGRLLDLGRVDIVTGRSPQTVNAAKSWLKEHEINFNSFVRTDSGSDKIRLNYDIFIDDSPEVMFQIGSNMGRHGILYTQPWNKNTPNMSGITRVEHWNEIPSAIRKIMTDTR